MDTSAPKTGHASQSDIEAVAEVHLRTYELVKYIEERLAPGRARSLAVTNLQTGAMWAEQVLKER